MKIVGFMILGLFYAVYIGKMILQKRRGIQTDQIAKGKGKSKIFYTEFLMKIATYSVVAVEIFSILTVQPSLPDLFVGIGAVLGLAGDICFVLLVVTMKDSWRPA